MRCLPLCLVPLLLAACGPRVSPEQHAEALLAFATVEQLFQHPRCSNCHIPGESLLRFDAQAPHTISVVCGPEGAGTPGLPCAACHAEANPPDSYGPQAPPGAPHWQLPPPDRKMAWIDLPTAELSEMIKDRQRNGDRDFAELIHHIAEDKLVLWGWGRQPRAGTGATRALRRRLQDLG